MCAIAHFILHTILYTVHPPQFFFYPSQTQIPLNQQTYLAHFTTTLTQPTLLPHFLSPLYHLAHLARKYFSECNSPNRLGYKNDQFLRRNTQTPGPMLQCFPIITEMFYPTPHITAALAHQLHLSFSCKITAYFILEVKPT